MEADITDINSIAVPAGTVGAVRLWRLRLFFRFLGRKELEAWADILQVNET